MFDQNLLARLYEKLYLIRQVEQHIVNVYCSDVVKSPVHLSIGQEAIAVGVCDPMAADDVVSNTYRCHATYLAKGGNLNQMMAELYGKIDGCAGGKAGSMHLVDIPNGVLGSSAVVATTIPVAAGWALAFKKQQSQRVVVSVFGDGATEEGCFLETINFAALHQLPIIFVCENNGLAIHEPLQKRWATEKLCERIATYNMPTHKINPEDIFKLHTTMTESLEYIRAGNGPVFIESQTYRWLEHVGPTDDHHADYRDEKALIQAQQNDQLIRVADRLDKNTRTTLETQVDEQIATAIRFAEQSSFPGEKELYQHAYAD